MGSTIGWRPLTRAVQLGAILGWLGCAAPEGPTEPPPEATPRPAAASYESPTVGRDLDHAREVIETRGYAADGDLWRGFLVQASPATRALRLRSGQCTVVAAAATPAVRELDLRVYDADGGEVGQDTLTGRAAALRYCPSQSGTYYLVARATSGNGIFASQAFTGPSGLEVRVDDLFPSLEPLRGEDRSGGEPAVGRP